MHQIVNLFVHCKLFCLALSKISIMKQTVKVEKKNNHNQTNVIIVPNGANKQLGDMFKKSQPFIRKALRGQTSHPVAIKVRYQALQMGGAYSGNQSIKTN